MLTTGKQKQFKLYQFSKKDFDSNLSLKPMNETELATKIITQGNNQVFEILKRISKINDDGFIRDIIFIHKPDKNMLLTPICANGIPYVRLLKSAGHARKGQVCYIRQELFKQVDDLITLGVKPSFVNLGKWEAYRGLAFSTAQFSRVIPRICVLPDMKIDIFDDVQQSAWYKNDKGQNKVKIEYLNNHPIKTTLFDGQCIHTPEYGKLLADSLNLNYVPVCFQLRLYPFCKGLSAQMDWKTFFTEHGVTEIEDRWHVKHLISDIDLICSESFFKGKAWFDNIDQFYDLRKQYYKSSNLDLDFIGVTGYSELSKQAKKIRFMNYQFLQVLDLKPSELIELAEPTKQYFLDIYNNADNPAYALKFLGLLGCKDEDEFNSDDGDFEPELSDTRILNKASQAIRMNHELLRDPYIKGFLYKQLKKMISDCAMGRIMVNATFPYILHDPYAMMQYAAGLDVTGCLTKKEFYSPGILGTKSAFRSPMIHLSEPLICNMVENSIAKKWMEHLDGQLVFSIHGTAQMRAAGADFDGDRVLFVDDEYITAAIRKLPAIVNISGDPVLCEPTLENIVEFDLKTLVSRVGEITNIATTMINRAYYEQGGYLDSVLTQLCQLQANEIDRVKTEDDVNIPAFFTKKPKKLEDGKYSIAKLIPYFMMHRYPQKIDFIDPKGQNKKGKYWSSMNCLCQNIEGFEKRSFIWEKSSNKFKTENLLMDIDIITNNSEEAVSVRDKADVIVKNFICLKKLLTNGLYAEEKTAIISYLFDKTRDELNGLTNNKRLLSSILVYQCYPKHLEYIPWCFAWEGLAEHLEATQSGKGLFIADEGKSFEVKGETYHVVEKEVIQKISPVAEPKREIKDLVFAARLIGNVEAIREASKKPMELYKKIYKDISYVAFKQNNDFIGNLGNEKQLTDDMHSFADFEGRIFKVEIIETGKKSCKCKFTLLAS